MRAAGAVGYLALEMNTDATGPVPRTSGATPISTSAPGSSIWTEPLGAGAGAPAAPYVVPASLRVRSMLKTLFIATSIVGLRFIRPPSACFGHSR